MSHGKHKFGPRSSVLCAAELPVKRLLISPVTAEAVGKCGSGLRLLARDLQSPMVNVVRSPESWLRLCKVSWEM